MMKRQDTDDQVVDNSGESSPEGTSETLASPEDTESPKETNTLTESSPAVNSETDEACKRDFCIHVMAFFCVFGSSHITFNPYCIK